MLLITVLLMTVVLVFLILGVQDFYEKQFFSQMESVFTQNEFVSELRLAAAASDAEEGASLGRCRARQPERVFV